MMKCRVWQVWIGLGLLGWASAGLQADSVLTVRPTDLAPKTAFQGQRNIPVLRLDLSVNSAFVRIDSLRIDKTGNLPERDIAEVQLWFDDDANYSFDPTRDIQLNTRVNLWPQQLTRAAGAAFDPRRQFEGPKQAPNFYSSLAYVGVPPMQITSGGRTYMATPANFLGLASNGDNLVTSRDEDGNPIVVPPSIRSQIRVGSVILDGFNTDYDNDFDTWQDADDRDGTDPGTDEVPLPVLSDDPLYQRSSRSLPVTIDDEANRINRVLVVNSDRERSLFIVYVLRPDATVGAKFGARLSTIDYVDLDLTRTGSRPFPDRVSEDNFPIASSLITVEGNTLAVMGENITLPDVVAGRADQGLMALRLAVDHGEVVVDSLTVHDEGDDPATDVTAIKLFQERNLDGPQNLFNPEGGPTDRDLQLLALNSTVGSIAGNVLTDNKLNLAPGALVGQVLTLRSGEEAGARYVVRANTSTTLTVDRPFQRAAQDDEYTVSPEIGFSDEDGDGRADDRTFNGLNLTVRAGLPVTLYVTYNFSPTATPGHRLQARVGAGDVKLTTPQEDRLEVAAGGIWSQQVTLHSRVVRVAARSLAPAAQIQGVARNAMLQLQLTAEREALGPSTLTSLTVHKTGTSTDANSTTDISRIRVYHDRNGNGRVDEEEDLNGNGMLDLDLSEDRDGNGLLDQGEDLNGNHVLDRHINEDVNGNLQLDPPAYFELTDPNKNYFFPLGGTEKTLPLDNPNYVDGRGYPLAPLVIQPRWTQYLIVTYDLNPVSNTEVSVGVGLADVERMPPDWQSDFAFLPPEDLNGNGRLDAGEDVGLDLQPGTSDSGENDGLLTPADVIPTPPEGNTLASAETLLVDHLTLTHEDRAPRNVRQGDRSVILGLLTLKSSANPAGTGAVTLQTLRFRKIGSNGRDEDMAAVRLYEDILTEDRNANGMLDAGEDLNGNGRIDDANANGRVDAEEGGTVIAATAVLKGEAVFEGLDLTVTQGTPRRLWVTMDVSDGALTNTTLGLRIPRPNSVEIAQPDVVAEQNFPLETSPTTVGDTLVVSGSSVAPANAVPGQKGVLVQQLAFNTTTNEVSLVGLRVTLEINDVHGLFAETPIPPPSDFVSFLGAYRDVTGNGALDSADELLGSANFSGSFTRTGNLYTTTADVILQTAEGDFIINVSRSEYLLLGLNLATKAVPGVDLSLKLDKRINPANPYELSALNVVQVKFPDSVSEENFALASDPLRIGDGLQVTGQSTAPLRVYRTQKDVPLLRLDLQAQPGNIRLERITLKRIGNAGDGAVSSLRLFRDQDGDGKFNPTVDTVQIGHEQTFAGGEALFSLTTTDEAARSIPGGQRVSVFVVADLAAGAETGKTVGVRLESSGDVQVNKEAAVQRTGFPMSSNLATIGDGLLVSRAPLAQDPPVDGWRVGQGRENLALLRLHLKARTGSLTLTQLRVDKVGGSDSDVAGVRLYVDNGDQVFSVSRKDNPALNDTQISQARQFGEGGFPGRVVFSRINLTVSEDEPKDLFVVADVSPTAGVGNPLAVEVRDESYLEVQVPDVVASFPEVIHSGPSGTIEQITAAGSGRMQITDGAAAYAANELVGAGLVVRRNGTPVGSGRVVSNTAQTFVAEPDTRLSQVQPGDQYDLGWSVEVNRLTVTAAPPPLEGGPGGASGQWSVEQGRQGVPILQLRLRANAGSILIRELKIRLVEDVDGDGQADVAANDVAWAYLLEDLNGDGRIDPGLDVPVAERQTFDSDLFATFTSVNKTVTAGEDAYLLIVFDFSAAANAGDEETPAHRVQVALGDDNPKDAVPDDPAAYLTVAGDDVIEFDPNPLRSAAVTVIGNTLFVEAGDLMPEHVAVGASQVATMRLRLSVVHGTALAQELQVAPTGTAPADRIVQRVRVFDDADQDGVIDSGETELAATSNFPFTGLPKARLQFLPYQVQAGQPRQIIVAYDIASTAPTHVSYTLGARVDAGDLALERPDQVTPDFAGFSSGSTRVGRALTVTAQSPAAAPRAVEQGQTVTVGTVVLTPGRGVTADRPLVLQELRLSLSETSTASDQEFKAVRLYREGTPEKLLGTVTFTARRATFSLATDNQITAETRFRVEVDIAADAREGRTFQLEVSDPESLLVDAPDFIAPGPFPHQFPGTPISISGNVLIVRALDQPAAPQKAPQGARGLVMKRLELSTPEGEVPVRDVRLDRIGSGSTDADVAAVKLYEGWIDTTTGTIAQIEGAILTDAGAAYPVDALAGLQLQVDSRRYGIVSNTATTITLDQPPVGAAAGSTYTVLGYGNGRIEPLEATLLGSGVFTSGALTIRGLSLTIRKGEVKHVDIAFDMAEAAALGVEVGVRIADETYFRVDPPNRVASEIPNPADPTRMLPLFPIESKIARVSGNVLTVTPIALSVPATLPQGTLRAQMLALKLRVDSGTAVVNQIGIRESGSGVAAENVTAFRLFEWRSADDLFQPDQDILVQMGTASFSEGREETEIRQLNIEVKEDRPLKLILTYDLATEAHAGQQVALAIPDNSYLQVNSPDTVAAFAAPLTSPTVTIEAAPGTLNVVGTSVVPGDAVIQGGKDVPFLLLEMRATSTPLKLVSLRVEETGTASAWTALSAVKLYTFTGELPVTAEKLASERLLSIRGFATGSETLLLSSLPADFVIPVGGAPTRLVLACDLAGGAPPDQTVGLRIAEPASIVLADPEAKVNDFPAGPIESTRPQIRRSAYQLKVSGVSLAPAAVAPGQANVALQRLDLASGAGLIHLTGATVNKLGSADDESVLAIRLIADANGNGVFNPGSDVQIGSSARFSQGQATFTGLYFPVPAEATRTVFVVIDLSPQAQVAETLGTRVTALQVAAPDEVDQAALPLSSTLATVLQALSVNGESLAPATAAQGEPNLALLRVALTSAAGAVEIHRLTVDLIGTAVDEDVAGVRLAADSNANRRFDPQADLPLSEEQPFVGRQASLAFPTPLTVSAQAPLNFFLVLRLQEEAVAGRTVGVRLTSAAAVGVSRDGQPTASVEGPFPLESGTPEIIGSSVLVQGFDLAPLAVTVGQQNVAFLQLELKPASGSATLRTLTLRRTGGTDDTDLRVVRLYWDADGNGRFDADSDVQLGLSQGLSGGVVTFSQLNRLLGEDEVTRLFVVADLRPQTPIGRAIGFLINHSDIRLEAPDRVADVNFPIVSTQAVVGGGLVVSGRSVLTPTTSTAAVGATGVATTLLTFRTTEGTATLTGLTFVLNGTLAPSQLARARLVRDDNRNNRFDPGQDLLVGAGLVPAPGQVVFTGLQETISTEPESLRLLVVLDLAADATVGRTVWLTLASADGVKLTPPTAVSDAYFPIPAEPNPLTVVGAVVTVSGVSLSPATALPGAKNVLLEQLLFLSSGGQSVLQKLRLERLGVGGDADVSAVRLYLDDGDGEFDLEDDTALTEGPLVNGVVTLSNLNVTIPAAPATLLVFVTLDLAPQATLGHTVGLTLPRASAVEVASPSEVASTNFPITSDTIGIYVQSRIVLPAGTSMVSVPTEPADPAASAVFNVPSGQLRIARWDPVSQQYRTDPADPFVGEIHLGAGYWLDLTQSKTLNIPGIPASTETPFVIPVSTGWNQVGHPFPFAVEWRNVRVRRPGDLESMDLLTAATQGLISAFAWSYRGNGPYILVHPTALNAVRFLEPGFGYWVQVKAVTGLELLVPPEAALPATPGKATPLCRPERPTPTADEWQAVLRVTSEAGPAAAGYFGVSASPTRAGAPPPAWNTGAQIYFLDGRSATPWAVDWRAPAPGEQRWAVVVEGGQPGEELFLSWPDLNVSTPSGSWFTLVDQETGRRQAMRTTGGYRFRAGETPRRFEVILEPDAGAPPQVTNVTIRPARGTGELSIGYHLSAPATMTTEITSLAGRRVRLLEPGVSRAAGWQTLIWDGRDERGARVPNGAYLCVIQGTDAEGRPVRVVRTIPRME